MQDAPPAPHPHPGRPRDECPLCEREMHVNFAFRQRSMLEGQPMQVAVRVAEQGGRLRVLLGELRPAPTHTAASARLFQPDGPQGPGGQQ